jgi:hypothetical protein
MSTTHLTAADKRAVETIAAAGTISNPELRDRHGFTLVGAQRRKLNTAGLVTSTKQGRYFVHTASAKPLDAPAQDPAVKVLHTVKTLGQGSWVPLAKLRKAIGGDLDATLIDLFRTGRLDLVPEDNRKALTAEDHAAAITIGGEHKHAARVADWD